MNEKTAGREERAMRKWIVIAAVIEAAVIGFVVWHVLMNREA